ADSARQPATRAVAPHVALDARLHVRHRTEAGPIRRYQGLVDVPSRAPQQQTGGRPLRQTADPDGAGGELRHAAYVGEEPDRVPPGRRGPAPCRAGGEGRRPRRRRVPHSLAGRRAGVGAVVRDSDRVTFRTEWLLPATAGDHARSEFGLGDSRGWRQGFSRTSRLFWGPCVTGGSARLLPIFADIAACSLARPQRQLQRRSLEQVLTTPRSRPIAGPATRCVCSSKAG